MIDYFIVVFMHICLVMQVGVIKQQKAVLLPNTDLQAVRPLTTMYSVELQVFGSLCPASPFCRPLLKKLRLLNGYRLTSVMAGKMD